jgi:hypothetical protein
MLFEGDSAEYFSGRLRSRYGTEENLMRPIQLILKRSGSGCRPSGKEASNAGVILEFTI